jgi:hypothetical protein
MLENLISELDRGPDEDARQEAVEDYGKAAQRREENDSMRYAQDSTESDHALRVALRRAGVPVGSQGSGANLERLWRNRPGSPAATAMDAPRRLPAHLSFDAMFPALASGSARPRPATRSPSTRTGTAKSAPP